ncbi:hypothetical protein [Paenibacillus sp. FSL L8-0709]|uniref:hypothetical protein n=1 Tax=Paenibacillus sp. FSL L8-0709 TaxID=2975312 RepID=UPI0030F7336F
MFLYQGRRKFESFSAAKQELDPVGRRICIHNEERVVTIRPAVVQTFPGTIEQLFELGLKLGGTPLEVWKENKKRCEEMDASKELAFAKSIQLMEQGYNAHAEQWKSQLTEYLKSLIEFGLENGDVVRSDSFEKVSDLLLSFMMSDEEGNKILALQLFSNQIHKLVTDNLGTYVISYLLQFSKELMALIRDPYSPYFNSNWEGILDPNERNIMIYKTLLEQPDLKVHHLDVVNRIKNDLFEMNPVLMKEVQNRTLLPLKNLVPESQEEWKMKDFLRDISPEALSLLLSIYFGLSNPLTIAHDVYLSAVMMKDVLLGSGDLLELDNQAQEAFIQKIESDVPLLRELIEKLEVNKDFLLEHMIELDKEEFSEEWLEHDIEDLFDEDDLMYGKYIDYFEETVMDDSELSWKAKALFSYVFFVESGYCYIDSILEESKESKQVVLLGLKELEKQGYGFINDNQVFSLHMHPEDLDDEDDEVLEAFISVLENEGLSWKAKGIGLFYILYGFASEFLLENVSIDSSRSIKAGLKELMENGLIPNVNHMTVSERKTIIALLDIKNGVKDWYNLVLQPEIRSWLKGSIPSIHLLNAIYPSMANLTALEMAVIADDVQMVDYLLQLENIELPVRSVDKPSITQTALICGSFSSLQVLLRDERIKNDKDSLYMTIICGIIEETDLAIIRDLLMTGIDLNATSFSLPSPLQIALQKKKLDLGLIKLLLEFGASSEMRYMGPDEYLTLDEYVEDKGTVTLKKLFRNNSASA